jgi:hypothetical protein
MGSLPVPMCWRHFAEIYLGRKPMAFDWLDKHWKNALVILTHYFPCWEPLRPPASGPLKMNLGVIGTPGITSTSPFWTATG